MILINLFIMLLQVYVLIGILFGIYFVIWGVGRIDTGMKGTSFWMRLIIFPGVVGLWIILLPKLFRNE